MSEKVELFTVALVLTMMSVGWYFYWVKPNDRMRYEIASCMSDNHMEMNKSNWAECYNIVVGQK